MIVIVKTCIHAVLQPSAAPHTSADAMMERDKVPAALASGAGFSGNQIAGFGAAAVPAAAPAAEGVVCLFVCLLFVTATPQHEECP